VFGEQLSQLVREAGEIGSVLADLKLDQALELAAIRKKPVAETEIFYEDGNELYYPSPPEWMLEAGCRGMGNRIFFSERATDRALAKSICAQCAVQEECRQFAMESAAAGHEEHGVWGGTDKTERGRLRNEVVVIDKPLKKKRGVACLI
jgi:WhiB family redox-sensing transcriptional regulator